MFEPFGMIFEYSKMSDEDLEITFEPPKIVFGVLGGIFECSEMIYGH
jgi:hypothetical protein